MKKIKISQIAKFIKKPFDGTDFYISNISTINELKKNSLVFCLDSKYLENKIIKKVLIISKKKINIPPANQVTFILSDNPKLEFAKIINNFFVNTKYKIEKTAFISKKTNLSKKIAIGHYSIIEEDVKIGDGTVIGNHVVIAKGTRIGKNCTIKSGAIIGESGFGFAFEKKTPHTIPHLGSVIIKDNVLIGSNTVINKGTITNTEIHNNVKIDDCCFVAHNCIIKENSIIIATAEISGSTTIEENVWVGPGTKIIQKINVGKNSTLGIGSIVRKNIPPNSTVQSLDSLSLREFVKLKRLIS